MLKKPPTATEPRVQIKFDIPKDTADKIFSEQQADENRVAYLIRVTETAFRHLRGKIPRPPKPGPRPKTAG